MSRKCIYHLNYCLMTPKMKKLLIINFYLMFNLFEVSVILLLLLLLLLLFAIKKNKGLIVHIDAASTSNS